MALGKIEAPQNRLIGSWRYAMGRLAARGDRLMSPDQVDRLFSLRSERELIPLLQELSYRGDNINLALEEGEAEDWDLLAQISPEVDSLTCLLLFRDAHNLKAALRAVLPAGPDPEASDLESYFLRPYRFTAARLLGEIARVLKKPVLASYELNGELPSWIERIIKEADQAYRKFADSAEIDRVCDQALWEEVQLQAKETKSPWFESYLDLQRYLKNIEILLRCRSLRLSHSYLEGALLPASEEEKESLLAALKLSDVELANRLFTGDLKPLAGLAKSYSERGGAAYFTAIADRILLDKLAEAKNGDGAEIILHYFLAREADRRSLRIVHSAIENQFSEERRRQMRRPAVR